MSHFVVAESPYTCVFRPPGRSWLLNLDGGRTYKKEGVNPVHFSHVIFIFLQKRSESIFIDLAVVLHCLEFKPF